MWLYEVDPPRTEDQGDGEDNSEWFTSLRAAMRRIRTLQKEDAEWAWCSITLRKFKLRGLPRAKLALAILNRRGWADEVVDLGEFEIPKRPETEGD